NRQHPQRAQAADGDQPARDHRPDAAADLAADQEYRHGSAVTAAADGTYADQRLRMKQGIAKANPDEQADQRPLIRHQADQGAAERRPEQTREDEGTAADMVGDQPDQRLYALTDQQ